VAAQKARRVREEGCSRWCGSPLTGTTVTAEHPVAGIFIEPQPSS